MPEERSKVCDTGSVEKLSVEAFVAVTSKQAMHPGTFRAAKSSLRRRLEGARAAAALETFGKNT